MRCGLLSLCLALGEVEHTLGRSLRLRGRTLLLDHRILRLLRRLLPMLLSRDIALAHVLPFAGAGPGPSPLLTTLGFGSNRSDSGPGGSTSCQSPRRGLERPRESLGRPGEHPLDLAEQTTGVSLGEGLTDALSVAAQALGRRTHPLAD